MNKKKELYKEAYNCEINNEIDKAIKKYKESAKYGNYNAYIRLGIIYKYEKENPKLANEYFDKVREYGYEMITTNLGYHFINGIGVKKNKKKGINYYKKSAEKGSSKAMVVYGKYLYKKGVGKYLKEAFKWFKKSAEKGNIEAQYVLANLYLKGEGCKKDTKKATEIFKDTIKNINTKLIDEIQKNNLIDMKKNKLLTISTRIKKIIKINEKKEKK